MGSASAIEKCGDVRILAFPPQEGLKAAKKKGSSRKIAKARKQLKAAKANASQAKKVKICLKPNKSVKKKLKPKGKSCRELGGLAPDEAKVRTLKIRTKKKAKKGRKYSVKFKLSGKGISTAKRSVKVKVR